MPNTPDLVNGVLTAAAVVSFAYVAYEALLVRRALAVGLYRRQAFGVGFLAFVFALNQVSYYIPTDGLWSLVGLGVFALFALGLLYWVDSAILTARRSDPLYRDTFHWSSIRLGIWVVSIAALLIILALSFLVPENTPTVGIYFWMNVAFTLLFFFPIYAAAISGVVVMPMAARRSKDSVFRRHLEWLFLFIAIQLVIAGVIGQFFQTDSGESTTSSIIDAVGLLVGLYPLYLSVKKLVPLYRFSDDRAGTGQTSLAAGSPGMPGT